MTKIKKPTISDNFTIDDIHKIRRYHNELRKLLTPEERLRSYNDTEFFRQVEIKYAY